MSGFVRSPVATLVTSTPTLTTVPLLNGRERPEIRPVRTDARTNVLVAQSYCFDHDQYLVWTWVPAEASGTRSPYPDALPLPP
jgi:hypothetical protein